MATSDTRKPPTLGELFDSFRREAFRLETLDDYSGSGSTDAYQAFLAGEKKPDSYNSDWISEVSGHVGEGKRIYRVHVLSRPLTPYLRFELGWGYRTNATAGEDFFILDVTDSPNPVAGIGDFWMFDEKFSVPMEYRDGTMTGYAVLTGVRAQEFVGYRDAALRHAVPFQDWWEQHAE
ncbi:DUF6879 family protein [Streptomyces marincola]|uniref:DUF6879 family protein n=1 Tax=Streptomyces marincola TaxID=2878388 RepID=UPI00210059E1|nr:DUF6879 family protein [Streptomyces marincola]